MNLINSYHHWLLRVPLIGTFLYHGYPKLGISVSSLGYLGYLIGPFEFFGALFLLIGPFTNDIISRIGSLMISIIMIGAIYMHLFKWNDSLVDVEWQILLLAVSLYLLVKDCPYLLKNNE